MSVSPEHGDGLAARIGAALREHHLIRGVAYYGIGAAVLQTLAQYFPQREAYSGERLQLVTLPFTLAVTRAFADLRAEDRAAWETVDLAGGLPELAQGAALGAAMLLTTLGIARAQGWVSAPAWGWTIHTPGALAQSLVMMTGGHLAVALNEELVFRGYGYTTLTRAMPPAAAAAITTALFAVAHPLTPRVLFGEAALGLALLAMRVRRGSIWMPVGYHWAWNALQGAVLGPDDGAPSLRPLRTHGPPLWIGRPGHPEPGLLSAAVSLSVALGVLASGRKRG